MTDQPSLVKQLPRLQLLLWFNAGIMVVCLCLIARGILHLVGTHDAMSWCGGLIIPSMPLLITVSIHFILIGHRHSQILQRITRGWVMIGAALTYLFILLHG